MSHVFPRVLNRALPIAARAAGATIWDSTGKSYIDASGGALVVNIGHGDEVVIEALRSQARAVAYAHGTQFTTDALERYAGAVAPLLPVSNARIYPVSGGSEAVETALKMARAYHLAKGEEARSMVIARHGSYHGNSLNALDASGRPGLRAPYEVWLGRTVHVPPPYDYRCEYPDHTGCGARHAEELDAVIRKQGPNAVACFVAEPVVGAALGAVVPPEGYWTAIHEVCRAHGVLVIADEVMTGFGRTGRWFASEHFGLHPDIITTGKGASSGYWPFGFAACSGEVFETIATTGFTHGFTYSHNAVGAAVAHAVLTRLADGDLVRASRRKGERLMAELVRATGSHPHVGDVRGLGLMLGIELVADRDSKDPFPRVERITEKLLEAARDLGLLLYPATGGADGTNGDAIMFGPPFTITDEELTEAVARFAQTLSEVLPST